MGDFNDEPFDQALDQDLNTSRDIRLVRERRDLLFNPFWRHLGHEDGEETACGSCFYRNWDNTRWRTFDQIMVSAELLTKQGLRYERARLDRGMLAGAAGARPHTTHLPALLDLVVEQPTEN